MELSFLNPIMPLATTVVGVALIIGYLTYNRLFALALPKRLPVYVNLDSSTRWVNSARAVSRVNKITEPIVHVKYNGSESSNNSDHLPQNKQTAPHKSTIYKLVKDAGEQLLAEAAVLYLLDRKTSQLTPYCGWYANNCKLEFSNEEVGHGIVGQAAQIRPGQALRINNIATDSRFNGNATPAYPFSNAVAVPVYSIGQGDLLAVFLVANKENEAHFSGADEQKLLKLVATDPLPLVVENLQLLNMEQQRISDLQIINRITQAITDPSTLKDVNSACRAILDQPYFKDLFNYDAIEICLWDEKTQTLTKALRLPESASKDYPFDTHHLNEGYTGWIAAHQTSLLVPNTLTFSKVQPKSGVENMPYRAFLGVPLRTGSKFLGTLEMVAKSPNAFTSSEVTLLEIVSNQVAIALENVRLFNLTNEQLTATR